VQGSGMDVNVQPDVFTVRIVHSVIVMFRNVTKRVGVLLYGLFTNIQL
jgi:hypothetical protein